MSDYLFKKYDISDKAMAHPELWPEISQRKFFEVMHLYMQVLKVHPYVYLSGALLLVQGILSQTWCTMQIMEWLEQLNVVHLDLKASNCIRTEAGSLKLCDAAGLMRVDAGEPSAAPFGACGQCHKLCSFPAVCCCVQPTLVTCPAVHNKAQTLKHSVCVLLQTWQRSSASSTSQTMWCPLPCVCMRGPWWKAVHPCKTSERLWERRLCSALPSTAQGACCSGCSQMTAWSSTVEAPRQKTVPQRQHG